MEQLYFQVSHSKDSRKGAKNRKEIQASILCETLRLGISFPQKRGCANLKLTHPLVCLCFHFSLMLLWFQLVPLAFAPPSPSHS